MGHTEEPEFKIISSYATANRGSQHTHQDAQRRDLVKFVLPYHCSRSTTYCQDLRQSGASYDTMTVEDPRADMQRQYGHRIRTLWPEQTANGQKRPKHTLLESIGGDSMLLMQRTKYAGAHTGEGDRAQRVICSGGRKRFGMSLHFRT